MRVKFGKNPQRVPHPGVFWAPGICYGSGMRSGGAVPRVALAGVLVALVGCGSPNPPPKASGPVPSAAPATTPNAGAAGAYPQQEVSADAADYRDPSKLLESFDADHAAAEIPTKPSNSGLALEIRERGPGQPWLLLITNRSDAPADLVADTRLLWFEVKLPEEPKSKTSKRPKTSKKPKTSLCKLPDALATGNQPEARLVVRLDPGEGVADQFDPRLYCFAEGDQKLLVPGAEIVPHFGWPEAPPKKRWKRGKRVEEPVLQKPPFVARQSLEAEPLENASAVSPKAAARLTSAGVTGSDKQLEGNALVLRSEYAEWTRQVAPPPTSLTTDAMASSEPEPPLPAVGLRLIQGSDAKAEHDATIRLTISNQSPLPTYVYFRREMVSFEVAGPAGITQCPGLLDDRTPERSAFLHLKKKATRSFSCRLAELCPRGTFAIPGLYLVYARFDATLSGQEQGIDAFVGPVYSRKPATVRIRTGEEAIFQKRPMMRLNVADAATHSTGGTQ